MVDGIRKDLALDKLADNQLTGFPYLWVIFCLVARLLYWFLV
jgi:hypothetical protein